MSTNDSTAVCTKCGVLSATPGVNPVLSDSEAEKLLAGAEKMAREIDQSLSQLWGGDGATAAFWLSLQLTELRRHLATPQAVEPDAWMRDDGTCVPHWAKVNVSSACVAFTIPLYRAPHAPEVTEAMVEVGAKRFGRISKANEITEKGWANEDASPDMESFKDYCRNETRAILTAALRAGGGQ